MIPSRIPKAPSNFRVPIPKFSPLTSIPNKGVVNLSNFPPAHFINQDVRGNGSQATGSSQSQLVSDKELDQEHSWQIRQPTVQAEMSFDVPLSQVIQSQLPTGIIRPTQLQHSQLKDAPSQCLAHGKFPTFSDSYNVQKSSSRMSTSIADFHEFAVPPQRDKGDINRSQHVLTLQPRYQEPSKATDNLRVGEIPLRSVTEIPRDYQEIFQFPYFNILQSLLFDEVLYTDKSIVASAPTGSGKTVIFELALIRLLMKTQCSGNCGKIIYMAPMKALCTERFQDWTSKFGTHGLACMEITGDSELDDLSDLFRADLICTTPEKWDSMSRRWKDNRSLFHQIQLFLIDEIHILNDPCRGATVEAVLSRMKTLQKAAPSAENPIRFVAVSATMPNYKDVAEWLGQEGEPAAAFNLGENYRPVKLDRIVLGYPFKEGTSDFRFDMNLSYRLRAIIDSYSHGKPALVFCSSRKSVTQTAEILAKNGRAFSKLDNYGLDLLQRAARSVHELKLSDFLLLGIGMHHAGMDLRDRHTVEELFRASRLPILISTSTLAMGVNLPAHVVIIKSTHFYNLGVVQEYSDMQVLQMIGRAGRPQFDTSATAVIMTKASQKSKYESLVNGTQLIESSLHKNLIEHLNAEIVLQTISEMSMVVEWIRHTFLYVRVMRNPKYYGLPANLSRKEVEKRLEDLCQRSLNQLASLNLVTVNEGNASIYSTSTGKLMARYCIAFETMKQFHNIGVEQSSICNMLQVMSQCTEFEDIQLRTNEKKILNSFNLDKKRETIRFPMQGKIKTRQMKVNCLIQAQLSCLPLQDFSLSQDCAKIFRVGQRIAKCLTEFMYQKSNYSSLLHAILVYKAFRCKLWFDSRYVARQLDGIGPAMSLALANSGLTSFQKLEQTNPREIEMIVNRHPPFGNQVKEAVATLPRYELAVEQIKCYKPNKAILLIHVDLLNRALLESKPSSHTKHQSILLVGDEDNQLVLKWKLWDAAILRDGGWNHKLEVMRSRQGSKLNISLLSQDWVGLDVHMEYEPVYSENWFKSLPPNSKATTPAEKLGQAMKQAQLMKQNEATQQTSTLAEKSVALTCNHKCHDKTTCGHKCCKTNRSQLTMTPAYDPAKAKKPRLENAGADDKENIPVNTGTGINLGKNQPRISILRRPGEFAFPSLNRFPHIKNSNLLQHEAPPEITERQLPGAGRAVRPVSQQTRQPGMMDNSLNDWADLDAFQQERQEHFINGRPEHLSKDFPQEDQVTSFLEDSLSEMSDMNEELDTRHTGPVTSTTPCKEDLFQCVNLGAHENMWLKAERQWAMTQDQEGKSLNQSSSSSVGQTHQIEHCDLDSETCSFDLGQEDLADSSAYCERQDAFSPALVSAADADADNVILISSSDSQVPSAPGEHAPEKCTELTAPAGRAHHQAEDVTPNQSCYSPIPRETCPDYMLHHFGRVKAWRQFSSPPKITGTERSIQKQPSGVTSFFVPKERIRKEDAQVVSDLFEGIF